MANLAIKGHPTRGKEVIEIFEMLGGINTYQYFGDDDDAVYFIEGHDIVIYELEAIKNDDIIVFTLEEFLEKFPYKVGDMVINKKKQISEILSVRWCAESDIIMYQTFNGWYSANGLKPYKEETMEDKSGQIKIDIPDGYEFFGIDDDSKIVLTKKQPQYPKTIEECAKLLSTLPHTRNGVSGYSSHALWKFQQLLICRDAYWKIAGEQMGLGKPWEPDWKDDSDKYFICYIKDELFMSNIRDCNRFLVFPTEEMQDAFYENFKDLIEECKEFL